MNNRFGGHQGVIPPIRAFCKGWTPTGPAGTLPGTVAVWPSDRDGARATWARPAASRRRSVKVHVRVSRAEQFGNKRCPADLVVREGDHGCRLRGNTCRFAAPGSPAASRRFPPFAGLHGTTGSTQCRRSRPRERVVRATRKRSFGSDFWSYWRTGSCQFVEKRLCLFQIDGVKALGEPAVDRRQQIDGHVALVSLGQHSRQRRGGAQCQ